MKVLEKYVLADSYLWWPSLIWINTFSLGRHVFFCGGSSSIAVILHRGKYGIKQAMFTPTVIIQSAEALQDGNGSTAAYALNT
jgi:hypothetical protein